MLRVVIPAIGVIPAKAGTFSNPQSFLRSTSVEPWDPGLRRDDGPCRDDGRHA